MGVFTGLTALGNPQRFMSLSSKLIPFLGAGATVVLATGLYMSFFVAPPDYQQGQTVRIMFIHVPSAWLSMMCYAMMVVSAIGVLVWRHPIADVAIKAAAPLGAAFTFLALITGSLWGKPMWGTWWVWDARLTSVLVLFILYIGVIALRQTSDSPQTARLTAILVLVGSINLPIIRFSVEWWNTLHQPASVIREGGPSIHPTLLWPLLVMALGMTLLFLTLHLLAMQNEVRRRRINALRAQIALRG